MPVEPPNASQADTIGEPQLSPGSRHLALPTSFASGRYQCKRLLGEGGQKRAYLAYDTQLDRDVVIALLKTPQLDAAGVAQIRREARTMGRLGDHPNIVTVYDISYEEDQPYIVCQYVEGGSLRDFLKTNDRRRTSIERALHISEDICRALAYAHERGIVHRDVKPNNIWLTQDDSAKLGDFGLAVSMEGSLISDTSAIAGTIAYIAPERAIGHKAEPRSDLYSLGVTLYEMLTGRLPFQGDVVTVISQHLQAQPVAPSWHNPDIPQTLEALILHLLAKTPGERPESAGSVLERLTTILSYQPTVAVPPRKSRSLDRLAAGVFVGREREMEELKVHLGKAASGCGQILMVVGEPGSGKTYILEQFSTYARLRNAQVLFGRCYEGEGAPAFWPWVQLIRSYVQEQEPEQLMSVMGSGASDIAQIIPDVLEQFPKLVPQSILEPEQARFRLFTSITSFLKKASNTKTLVLCLDDIHWADKASLLLLEFLAQEIKNSRLLVVCTHRNVALKPELPLMQTLGELTRHGMGPRIELIGFAEQDVTKLIEVTAGMTPPPRLSRAVCKQTEGNPFFVNEIVRLLVAEGRLEGDWEVTSWNIAIPHGVREVVNRRLAHISKDCYHVLSSASVIGREFDLAALEHLIEFSADLVLEMLEEAIAARIVAEIEGTVGRYKFCHAIVRETLYEEISTTRRVRLHRRIGATLEQLYSGNMKAHLAELAYHFCCAASIGDGDKAVDYAVKAAEQATSLLAFEEAVKHYEAALAVFDSKGVVAGEDRCELLLALGTAQKKADMPVQARETFLQSASLARECGSSKQLAKAAMGLAVRFTEAISERVDQQQIELIKEALRELGEEDTAYRVRLLAQLAWALYYVSWQEREVLSRQALEMARRVNDAPAHLTALYSRCHALEGFARAEERLEIASQIVQVADQAGEKEMALKGHYRAIRELLELGDIQGMEREIQSYTRLAEELRQPLYKWYIPFFKASLALLRGEYEASDRFVAEAKAAASLTRDPNMRLFFAVLTYSKMKVQGRLAEIEPAVKDFVENYPMISGWQALLAGLYAELDRKEDAREIFSRMAALDLNNLPRDGSFAVVVSSLCSVCWLLGDSLNAQKLYQLLLPFKGHFLVAGGCPASGGPAARALAIAASTIPHWQAAIEHFEEAIETDTRMGFRPYLVITLRDYARVLLTRRERGDGEKAMGLLQKAHVISQELGARQMVDRIQGIMNRS